MEHAQALENHAADLYVLGELSDTDAEAFEAHFFDCVECADEVRLGVKLLDGGQEMLREDEAAKVVPITSRKSANVWMPIAAAAMLVIVIGGPLLVSRAKAPAFEIVHGQSISLSGTRSAEENVVSVKDGEPFVLYAEITAEGAYARYEVRVLDSKGKLLFSRPVTSEEAKDSLPLVFREMGAGTYELVVVGVGPAGQYAEVSRTRFTVKRQGSNAFLRRERWNSPTTQARLARAA